MYDVVIIGSGPAGLSAAVYAARGGLDFVVVESALESGGQILNTLEVDNYPGLYHMNGYDLGRTFREHAEKLGARLEHQKVTELQVDGDVKKVICEGGMFYETKTIVLATGTAVRRLNVEGEKTFASRGVSYCATCDGNFFHAKTVAVVGGGDTAISDAIYLAGICKKVYIIHRRDHFRAAMSLQNQLYEFDNVEILWDSTVEEIQGTDRVEQIIVRNKVLEMEGPVLVDGVFVAIGSRPVSGLLEGKVEMDEHGYIIAGENGATSLRGVFVAGDVRQKELRQVITAAADGANAINSVMMTLHDGV